VINATGSALNTVNTSNLYIKPVHSFGIASGGTTANVITIGGYNFGLLYCNVQTGQICVIGQTP
ncbi:MAG: hypothetical protein EBR93_05180, partial [Bacteroidetes bacterium]|nr:hypothetical protein [Bacteroidota bacterium]